MKIRFGWNLLSFSLDETSSLAIHVNFADRGESNVLEFYVG
jgi:hypothetical protein